MLTQAKYALFTGQSLTYSEDDWSTVVKVASMRLAAFLCLDALPELTDDNEDLAMLLANFIAAMLKFQGDGDRAQSKSVRNFTISFKASSAADAFSQIANQYGDIIDKYSKCFDFGVAAERVRRYGCELHRLGF